MFKLPYVLFCLTCFSISGLSQNTVWQLLHILPEECLIEWENACVEIQDGYVFNSGNQYHFESLNDSTKYIKITNKDHSLEYAFCAKVEPYVIVRYMEDLETGEKTPVYNNGVSFVPVGDWQCQGSKYVRGQFKNGVPVGKWQVGMPEGYFKQITLNELGIPDGPYMEYYGSLYSPETIKTSGNYGVISGEASFQFENFYHTDDKKTWSTRQGKWIFYHPNGQVAQEIEYGPIR